MGMQICPAVRDPSLCAVLLKPGDYAMFTANLRCGGPGVTRTFQAMELIDQIVVPSVPYDPAFNEPYSQLLPKRKDSACEVRAKLDQDVIAAWYDDYKTKGEKAHMTSHHGEVRANMVCAGGDRTPDYTTRCLS
ncbi:hypothetical protein HWV62_40946 [Athelia sp. TMB]|nr:hypothetical protein HWV62_40946 [Athelia sp. TMB]